MKKEEAEQLITPLQTVVETLQNLIEKEPEPIALDPAQKTIFDYVTIDGEEPEAPTNFFHSKKFLGVAGTFGLLIGGYLSYLMFFAGANIH